MDLDRDEHNVQNKAGAAVTVQKVTANCTSATESEERDPLVTTHINKIMKESEANFACDTKSGKNEESVTS